MDEKEKIVRVINAVGELENSLKNLSESAKEKSADIRSFAKVLRETENLPTIDPESLWPVAHWEPVDPKSDMNSSAANAKVLFPQTGTESKILSTALTVAREWGSV